MRFNKQVNVLPARNLTTALLALVFTTSLFAQAQAPQNSSNSADEYDQLLEFSQCMRENGFSEFPDPDPSGRLRLQMDAESAPKLRAAREACRDKVPSGIARLMQANNDPEHIERLLKFAQCVRDNGISDFPDPDSQGAFNIDPSTFNSSSPRTREAMASCGEVAGSNLMIRLNSLQ